MNIIKRPHGTAAPGRRGPPKLPEGEREHLKAEVVYWGLQQAQQGRMLSEDELQQEYDRRLIEAEQWLRDSSNELRQEYDRRRRQADDWLRESREKQQQQQGEPPPAGAPSPAPEAKATRLFTRRNLILLGGLLGAQGAAAFGAARVEAMAAPIPAAAADGVPAAVKAAGGANAVDGSDDPVSTAIDQVKLAALNAGQSLYAVFSGPVTTPLPGHLDRLVPPPPLPAQPGRVREFSLTAQDTVLEIAKGVKWHGWTYNGAIPGPLIRVTQGDHVKITLTNKSSHPHSIHLHSIHPGNQDGVFQVIPAGGQGTYEFSAEPFGVYPYHCHIEPLDQHVARGLYGVMIIDPPKPRPPAREFAMIMNGYDLNFDKQNELYSINGMPGYYHDNPIELKVGEPVRVYLVNMTEYDAVNSFHLHGNMFNYIPLGTSLTPSVLTDVVHLGIADRGILEFSYKYPGQFMFHAHQNELTIHGWNAIFNVT